MDFLSCHVQSYGMMSSLTEHKTNICRDIYYYDPTGFGSQRVVDNVIEDIAHTIGVDRSALNVVSQLASDSLLHPRRQGEITH